MRLRLRADALDFWVDVRVRGFGSRWLAVAQLAGDQEIGLGNTFGTAVANALASLGPKAVAALLADPTVARAAKSVR
jgi:hypothetical protein